MQTNVALLVTEIKRLLNRPSKILGSYPKSGNQNHNWQLLWLDPKLPEKPPEFSKELLTQERELMKTKMLEFFAQNLGNLEAPVFLVQAVAGMGKSTSAIQVAQEVARMGYKVLYLMPRHDYWKDIINNPMCNSDMWLHWLSFDGIHEETKQPMCRYPKAIKSLSLSGYQAIEGCINLCGQERDNYIAVCPYRKQARTEQPIVAGVHQHIVTGLSIKFDLIIIDESIMSAMLNQRLVPAKFLISDCDIPVVDLLMEKLFTLSQERKIYNGFDLAYLCEGELSTIFKLIKADEITFEKPELPESFDERSQVQYWYILDFLRLMAIEYQLWQQNETEGMSRVKLDGNGLTLYLKNDDFWQETPKIILDATGESETIANLLGKEVIKHSPNIGLKGKVFQVCNRLNNITALYDKAQNTLTPNGNELKHLIEQIRHSRPTKNGYGSYNTVGLITFKSLRPHLEHLADITLHFGGNRGTNAMEGVDCLIIAGTPSPSDYDIMNIANQMLFSDEISTHSNIVGNRPYRTSSTKPYLYEENGKQPHRLISGYDNKILEQVLYNFRDAELVQSLYRARPLTCETDVWLLTSVPLEVWLDKLTEKASDLINLPECGIKILAQLDEYCTGKWIELSRIPLSRNDIYSVCKWNPSKYQLVSKDKNIYFRGLNV